MKQNHSLLTKEGRAIWYTERLWKLARELKVFSVEIESIPEFDHNCWFGVGEVPTCRAIARHARKIADADLSFPIILSSDGRLMDGGHRLAKAWISGLKEIDAVQFDVDPKPDLIESVGVQNDLEVHA